MTTTSAERLARVALGRIAEPGNADVGRAISEYGAVSTLRRIRDGQLGAQRLRQREANLSSSEASRDLATYESLGARAICPEEPEWPTQLDDLGDKRPYLLWVRGPADLRFSCLRSVSIVGSRACTGYGAHVAGELSAVLAERGFTSVSGGAYGIDGAAHRGALAAGGTTVVVLASGLDVSYPRGHESLFARVMDEGLLVSEWPPGATPTRPGFLVRNRVIAALSRGTVVIEAAVRSGALNTARHAAELGRSLMAVPGPVTSPMSAGCHVMLREDGAICVTGATEVVDQVGSIGADLAPVPRGPVLPRDVLGDTATRVLEAVPARGGQGPATISVSAGTGLDITLRCLGELAAGGFVERCEHGWRLTKAART